MSQLRQLSLLLSVLLFGSIVFFFGWKVADYLFENPPPESDTVSIALRGYSFEEDIAEGGITPLAMSSNENTAVSLSTQQVVEQKLKGLSRQKHWVELKRIIKTAGQVSRSRLLELLTELERTTSIERKKEIQNQISAFTSSPGNFLQYGIFIAVKSGSVGEQ